MRFVPLLLVDRQCNTVTDTDVETDKQQAGILTTYSLQLNTEIFPTPFSYTLLTAVNNYNNNSYEKLQDFFYKLNTNSNSECCKLSRKRRLHLSRPVFSFLCWKRLKTKTEPQQYVTACNTARNSTMIRAAPANTSITYNEATFVTEQKIPGQLPVHK